MRFDGETSFRGTVFRDSVSFRDVGIVKSLLFTHTQFPGLTLFDGLHRIPDPDARFQSGPPGGLDESALVMHGVRFLGPASFDGVRVRKLLFPTNLSPTRRQPPRLTRPLFCDEPVSFRGLRCEEADFSGAVFQNTVDFSRASFEKSVSFRQAVFKDSAFFGDTVFPTRGLNLDRVLFVKRGVSADQLTQGQLDTDGDSEVWESLELAFRNAGNLEAMNEATYQKRLMKMRGVKGTLLDRVSYVTWGFGVRPWRTVGWMLGLFGAFYAVCVLWASRIEAPVADESAEQKLLAEGLRVLREVERRLGPPGNAAVEAIEPAESAAPAPVSKYRTAFDYARDSVLKPFYGWKHTTSRLLGTMAVGAWAGMAALVVCFFQVLTNVSPFVRELVGKILPL